MVGKRRKMRPAFGFFFCASMVCVAILVCERLRQDHRWRRISSRVPLLEDSLPAPKKYLLYDSRYGSLNNQLNSLLTALTMAKLVGAIVVTGPAYTPGGGKVFTMRNGSLVYLVGHYFERHTLSQAQPIITLDEFLQSPDSALAQTPGAIAYYYETNKEAERSVDGFYHRYGIRPKLVEFPPSIESRHPCDKLFRGNRIQRTCGHGPECNVMLTDFSFTNFYDCSAYSPWWTEVRKHLIPVPFVQRTVEDFVQSVDRPLITVHIRFMGGDDDGRFLEKLLASFAEAARPFPDWRKGTIYVLGMKDVREEFNVGNVVPELRKMAGPAVRFVTCANMTNCQDSGKEAAWITPEMKRSQEYQHLREGQYLTILLEEWLAVNSDLYIGRTKSTFSQNVDLWQRVLKGKGTSYLY